MQDPSRSRSLSLDDINVGVSSSCQKDGIPSSLGNHQGRVDDAMDEEDKDSDTLPELESPAIENLQDRLLLTPIRWQLRSEAASSAPLGLFRRDSAPATLLQKEEATSRRCSNPALLETIEEGQVSCRRKSMPAVMIHGLTPRQRGGAHLSPRRTLLNAATSPAAASSASLARRRSMPEIVTHQKGSVTLETFYPPPRRNSLMSCSLSEVATRFELLNTHSRVPEENELLEKSRAGYERNNGTGVGSTRSLPPITL